jgi:prepilin-type processing-associated H-X9-DG protein
VAIAFSCECGEWYDTPEQNAGRRALCPKCGRELIVPIPEPFEEVFVISDDSRTITTSGKAIASLVLGALFFLGCLSGIPAILVGWDALREIRQSNGRLRGRGMAVGGIALGFVWCMGTLALWLPWGDTERAARRAQCVNNLKQIGLAFHNYLATNECFPPAAITDKNGKPLLSWRVAILPYLESGTLYSKFHLDEPWDSQHNLALLEPIPMVYRCPKDEAQKRSSMTRYQVVVGPRTAFSPDFAPLPISEFTDGTATTALVIESSRLVSWTKPDDERLDATIPFTGLSTHHVYGSNMLFGDGSVRFLKAPVVPRKLGALFTRNGQEVIRADDF